MDNRENQITSSQLMGVVLSIQLGMAVLSLPAYLAIAAGHDGWISVLLFGTMITALIAIIIKLMNRYDNQSIYEINKFLYGKYLGGLLNLAIVFYLWYSGCLCLRTYINILHIHLLRLTPTLILCVMTLIPTFYLTWYGLKYVARFTFMIYISLTFCCILFFLVFKYLRLTFLMPIGVSGLDGIKASFKPCIYAFLGYEVISVIYPEITNKQKTMKYALGANIITTIFLIILVLVTTSFFGEEMLKRSIYPIIKLARSYEAPVLERIDLTFICFWLPAMSMATRGYFSIAYYSIHKLLNLKKKAIHLIVFTCITIFLSSLPQSNSQLDVYNNVMTVSGTLFTIFLVICYLFSFIRKNGVKPHV